MAHPQGRALRELATPINELLTRDRPLTTPTFQRAFSWSEEEALTLLSDLRAHMAGATASTPPYLLGSVVLLAAPDEDLIVDGHQRLTTLTILFALLRDMTEGAASTRFRAMVERVRSRRFMRGPFFAPSEPERVQDMRLRPRDLDAEFLLRTVQEQGATIALAELDDAERPAPENEAQANIVAVALALRGALAEMAAAERAAIGEHIAQRCAVLEARADTEEQAFQIFRSLNGRGKDLTETDRFKAELLEAADPAEREEAAAIWERIEADLGAERFQLLFTAIRRIERPKARRRTAIAEIKATLNTLDAPLAFIRERLEPDGRRLEALSAASLTFDRGSAAAAEAVNALLRALRRIPNRDWIAPALAFLRVFEPSAEAALRFFTDLERLAAALLLHGVDDGGRARRYDPLTEALRDKASDDAVTPLLDLTAQDKELALTVLQGALYRKNRLRLAVLLRLEEHLAGPGAPKRDRESLSVEHVLPRRPAAGGPWCDAWPTLRDRRYWTDRLGNLALLPRGLNTRAAALPFDEKKTLYAAAHDGDGPLALIGEILEADAWTPESVAARQDRLIKAAAEIWRL